MIRLAFALALSALSSAHAGAEPSASADEQAALLKGFALARCLGRALPVIKAEADAASGGYLERGSVAFGAYEEIDEAAAASAARPYESSTGADLSIMKCYDFLASQELAEIVARHAPAGR